MQPSDSLIYFDNNATTAVDPAVIEEMLPFLTEHYGNPSSPYQMGKHVAKALETARERVATLLQSEAQEIIFTSCGTEATNAAIHSALAADPDKQHVVTTRVEHSATLKTCELLAKKGVEITWIGVDENGQIDLEDVEKAVRSDTALLTVMWANNETGTILPVETLGKIAKAKGVYFHTDAVQAAGKIPLSIGKTGAQFASLSGHKLHCPKGIGALYVGKKTRFTPLITGGSQEGGKRGGTQNVASIVAFGKACELAAKDIEEKEIQLRSMRDYFEQQLFKKISKIQVNGDARNRLPNTSNLEFEHTDAEALLILLDEKNLACSAGSACTSGSVNPSHVLKAMGRSDTQARSSLRFSFSLYNSLAEIDRAVDVIEKAVAKVRSI